ncbi:hypothetical protein HS088_TW18G00502 [Tripterygium wilfordii]|uniref:WEB family protein n=1 Tax=Tripterygium wilfordii TaxID=458696 RepID=A0A7J7CD59_TRIWF|nr:WEB family protein At3g51220 [Tripterygium wilfordii]KAF5731817.1 hypothetical protein HS088_TW18G00502 [Tripterygium wilfordii]
MDTQIKDVDVDDYASTVDTSRPFSSVKEAIAIFGERLLTGEMYSPKPPHTRPVAIKSSSSPRPVTIRSSSSSPSVKINNINEDWVLDTLQKIEAELKETKVELKLLKERESETEIALASLNAELHKNRSKMAEAEAAAAAKSAAARENNPTLAQILSVGHQQENYGRFGSQRERKVMVKKKPIIPLVGDLFSRKKGSSNASTSLHSSLFASSELYFS